MRHWQEKRESVCISLKSEGCRCFSGGPGNGKGGRSAWFLFFLLLLFLAQFVWEIDWSGNRRYTESELNHYLQTLQIEEGIPKKRISCARLEEELRESFEDITWVSVRLHGTRLFIRLRESEVPVRQEVESGEACDLAAVSDARITSVVVRNGIPLVQAGDTVEKGQLLVSGTVPITDDGGEEISSYRVRADADIYGIRERGGRKELPLWREIRTETGKKRYGIMKMNQSQEKQDGEKLCYQNNFVCV